MSRKSICPSCGNIIDMNQTCECKEDKTEQNQKKREYYQKNKETLKPLNTKRWKTLRKRIINRDNGICQRCFLKYEIINYENLQVHHIKPRIHYPELIFEENNLLTLCKTCNVQLDTKELDFDYEAPEDEEHIPIIF